MAVRDVSGYMTWFCCFTPKVTVEESESKLPSNPGNQLLNAAEEQLTKWQNSRRGKFRNDPSSSLNSVPTDLDTANASKVSRASESSTAFDAGFNFITYSTGKNTDNRSSVSQVGFQISSTTFPRSSTPSQKLKDMIGSYLHDPSACLKIDSSVNSNAVDASGVSVGFGSSNSRPISMLSSQLSKSLKRISGSLKRVSSSQSTQGSPLHALPVGVGGGDGGVDLLSMVSMPGRSSSKYLPSLYIKEIVSKDALLTTSKSKDIPESSTTPDTSTSQSPKQLVNTKEVIEGHAAFLSPQAPLWLPGIDYDMGSPAVVASQLLLMDPNPYAGSQLQIKDLCQTELSDHTKLYTVQHATSPHHETSNHVVRSTESKDVNCQPLLDATEHSAVDTLDPASGFSQRLQLPSDPSPSPPFDITLVPEATGGYEMAHSLTPAPQRTLLLRM
ncbi:hypothetical protein CEUSTIGMA_g4318.t1 [Chlamydomonas eustigma]|uniref:Uncharacterized protein n=1 Tax=Chlamydomonas eustigma TaxID=1157962 RepID=A0A250X1V6_9CHLO|nr:hypothetical protein CEUSTIGMA_g4318.t1 [Chlamydomonas eustigma]|eukprot:GAX76872.1 hypothetical protein CEUSTIGMA_g4318.t1 [Chlamydomonas eustigma]